MAEYLRTLAKALESIGIVAAWSMWVSLLFGILNTVLIIFVLLKLRKYFSGPVTVESDPRETNPKEINTQAEAQEDNKALSIILLILFGIGILAMAVFLAN